jgi:hypothetical protein
MNSTLIEIPDEMYGWIAFASSELFPIITKELSKRGYGKQLNSMCDLFIFVVYTLFICGCINQATIWFCETVFSRDIDGDGVKGKPENERPIESRDSGSRRSSEERCQEIEISNVVITSSACSDSVIKHPFSTEK